MGTEIHRPTTPTETHDAARRLAGRLAEGALVAFPTETVYGIAALAADPDAVARLREVKGRPEDKPLSIHTARPADVLSASPDLHPRARRLVERLLPGPLTLVLPGPDGTTVGWRVPDHAAAREFLAAAPGPVVATSANLSGEPSLTTGDAVVEAFRGRIDGILDGGPTRYRKASTVARVVGPDVEILREGVLSAERVREAAAYSVHFVCTGNLCRSPMADGILRHLVAERLEVSEDELPAHGVRIFSSGTAALTGDPATPPAVDAAAKWGADITGHLAQPLTPTLIRESSRISTATAYHTEVILTFAPEAANRVRPMRRDGRDVRDPYGQPGRVYRKVAAEIREEMTALADETVAVVRGESSSGEKD